MTALIALVLISLARRRRWAWVVLVVLEGGILISFAFDFTDAVAFIVSVVSFALLISPPMRRYTGPPHTSSNGCSGACSGNTDQTEPAQAIRPQIAKGQRTQDWWHAR